MIWLILAIIGGLVLYARVVLWAARYLRKCGVLYLITDERNPADEDRAPVTVVTCHDGASDAGLGDLDPDTELGGNQ